MHASDEEMSANPKIPIGVSSCLLGHPVRFDGGHKRNPFIINELDDYFSFEHFCPEMAIGLGTPRPTLRLIASDRGPICVDSDTGEQDFTEKLRKNAQEQTHWQANLFGYILQKDSPSCGMERVKVYPVKNGPATRDGVGVYAQALMSANPLMPVEEEGRLCDPVLRENFIHRVIIYWRWHQMLSKGLTRHRLNAFHAHHKWIIFSHSQPLARKLGKELAESSRPDATQTLEVFADHYISQLMALLKKPATRKNHVNVLQHIQGFLKQQLSGEEKAELCTVVEDYRQGLIPLITPITLFRHHFLRHPHPYMTNSFYLNPHPKELKLLNQL